MQKLLFFIFLITSAKLRLFWIKGNQRFCLEVCTDISLKAVYSGVYTNRNRMYVCRANSYQNRAGYNLNPSWTAKCFVGHGGAEKGDRQYDCLCER